MQLKEKTYYRTRDGRKAYIITRSVFSADLWLGEYEEGCLGPWRDDGVSPRHPDLDLVSEWQEPLKVECWALVVTKTGEYCERGKVMTTYPSKERAEFVAQQWPDLVVIKLTGEEGQR